MRKNTRRQLQDDLISATEIASFAYCPEAWRLEHGLELEANNRESRVAGDRHHAHKALAERLAGGSIILGRLLITIAAVLLLLLLWRWL